jgi:hypothetical protein
VQRAQLTGEHLIMSGSLWVKNQLSFGPNFSTSIRSFLVSHPRLWRTATRPQLEQLAIGPHARPALRWTALSTWSMAMISFCWIQLGLRAHGCNLSWSRPYPGDFTLLSGAQKSILMMSKSAEQEYLRARNSKRFVSTAGMRRCMSFFPTKTPA